MVFTFRKFRGEVATVCAGLRGRVQDFGFVSQRFQIPRVRGSWSQKPVPFWILKPATSYIGNLDPLGVELPVASACNTSVCQGRASIHCGCSLCRGSCESLFLFLSLLFLWLLLSWLLLLLLAPMAGCPISLACTRTTSF